MANSVKIRFYRPYNLELPDWVEATPLGIEKYCYLIGHPVEKGGLGKAGHFRKIAELLWGPTNTVKQFIWHPWAEDMNEGVHKNPWDGSLDPHTGLSGCGKSGKTEFLGIFGLINWLVAPTRTLVLCTSTDIKAARKRVWGAISSYFDSSEACKAQGRLVDSMAIIRTLNEDGQPMDDRQGVALVAGDRKQIRDAIGKIIGAHNDRVFMLADELAELSPAILEASFSNLSTNPHFQILSASNFRSRYDPFGEFVEPKEGWDSIDVEMDGWQTVHGHCLHFDGTKSPNLSLPKEIYPIYGRKNLKEHKERLGDNSAGFWRMCRSFESPIGLDDALYDESDFLQANAYAAPEWKSEPIRWASLDPSFTQSGDRCIMWIGSYGVTTENIWTIAPDKMLILRENVTVKKQTRNYQIAEQFIKHCQNNQVQPEHSALDATGGGAILGDIIWEKWSHKVLKVDFSGAPTTMIVSAGEHRTAKDTFDRRVSELWGVGREFLRYGQFKNMTHELVREMKARRREEIKGVMGLKIRVETKKDMRERIGFSPDCADAFFVGVDLCRQRLNAVAGAANSLRAMVNSGWKSIQEKSNQVYAEADYLEPASDE